MDSRRHNVRSEFHLCALFSERSVLTLLLKALRAQRKTLCPLWFAVLDEGFRANRVCCISDFETIEGTKILKRRVNNGKVRGDLSKKYN